MIGPPILLQENMWEYIIALTATWNWDWGRAIPFLGIHKWDFRCIAGIRRDGICKAWWAARGRVTYVSVFSFYTVFFHFLSPSPWLFPFILFLILLSSHPVPRCCPFLLLLLFLFHSSFLHDLLFYSFPPIPPKVLCPETNPGHTFRQTAALLTFQSLIHELRCTSTVFRFSFYCARFNTVSSAARHITLSRRMLGLNPILWQL